MDNLERFKPENLTKEVIEEINSMSTEELSQLENIPGFFLIRDKSTTKSYTGQSTYKNLAVLHRLGFNKRYEVVGVYADTMKNSSLPEEIPAQDEFIAPEQVIVNTEEVNLGERSGEHVTEEIEDDLKNGTFNEVKPEDKVQEKEIVIPELQEFTTEQGKESIIPTDIIEPEKEIITDSKNQEANQNAAPEKEEPTSEVNDDKSTESKATKSPSRKTK